MFFVFFGLWWLIHYLISKRLIVTKLYKYDYELRIKYFKAIIDRNVFKSLKLLWVRRFRLVYQKRYIYVGWLLFFVLILGFELGIYFFLICSFLLFGLSSFYWLLVFFMDWRTRANSDITDVEVFIKTYFPDV